jgi:Holliday junction resolvasome RuvABC DNA-binding subunit
MMLGFPKAAADKALQNANKQQPGLSVEELIKMALKAL